jgi:hypothetical protein
MATRTFNYKECDGCHRSERHHELEFASSRVVHNVFGPARTVDICADCDDAGKFFCHLCARVHDDDNPCDAILRRIESSNK